ncbi:hypothetical protein [Streptococcus oricebi]|uniref:LXG domain-containing protein n=1 Tax=Streptococcus oricebi TaxID=1547447 RepID=A0ABS5B675_9STRE|nr:hypothetical protein [Streptococcus oricebi]MBP2624310.1 hypothetical protein [Streptococcus oricebi]
MSLHEDIGDFLSGAVDTYTKIEKDLERSLIQQVFAPVKLRQASHIASNLEEKITKTATSTKGSLVTVSSQLDTAIRGTWSTKIQETIEKKSSAYDEI